MTRTLLALSLIAAAPIATAAIGTPRVTAQAPATSIELDILQKARLGTPHAEVAATLWRNMLAACDDRDGVLAEYHDGAKRTQFDTREGAVRQRAYATCRLLDGAQDLVIGNTRVPAVTVLLGNGMPPTPGLVEATGPLRAAYDAVTVHIHKACADAGRRVRFASFAFGAPRVGGETKVEARFSCNSAVGASSYVD